MTFVVPVHAETTLIDYFVDPLGDSRSWSFEQSGYWTAPNGGQLSSTYKLDGSYSWFTSGGGDYVMYRNVVSSCITGYNWVSFSFWFRPQTVQSDGSQNYARAEITYKYMTGGPSSVSEDSSSKNSSIIQGTYTRTVCGDWVRPTELKWYEAHVKANLPDNTIEVKVTIHGQPNFKAYIDYASYCVYDSSTTSNSMGNLGLAISLWKFKKEQGVYHNGQTLISTALYAQSKDGTNYRIRALKLMVELVPSSQDALLNIDYACQANDKNWDVDPAADEKFSNDVSSVAANVIGDVLGVIGGVVVTSYAGPAAGYGAAFLISVGTSTFLENQLNVNLDNPGPGNTIWEQWNYPTTSGYDSEAFVKSCTGHYEFSWKFNLDSATSFQIRVTAQVNWGLRAIANRIFYLKDMGWTSISRTVIINRPSY